jgi:metal-dependent amidase/aminoacylase/carboxypeptidase family protein
MDSLPTEEAANLPRRSQPAGRMHGCGLDAHRTMLLGGPTASRLSLSRRWQDKNHFRFSLADCRY